MSEKKKTRKPITMEAVKKAFGGDVKRMEAFVKGSRKAYATGQPGDNEADTNARN